MRDTIVFDLAVYPTISTVIKGYCNDEPVVIATESLMEKLYCDTNDFVSDKASAIDEGIFYYVPDEVMDKDEDEIAAYVLDHIV